MLLSDFFMELMAYTAQVSQGRTAAVFSYDEVRRKCDELAENSREQAIAAGFQEEEWREAFFAACAWMDETILCSGWPGRKQWEQSPYQVMHFQTMNAGEEFFLHLSNLAPEALPVREVYAYCLALGFKGRYFLPEDEKKLQEIARTNMILLRGGEEFFSTEKLFPEAYSGETGEVKRKRWRRGLSLFGAVVIVVSSLAVAALFSVYKALLMDAVNTYFRF